MSAFSARVVFVPLFFIMLAGCGKYGAPFAPESLSPRAVELLQVTPLIDGVKFSWKSPGADQRGKDLRSIGGYKLYRSEGTGPDGFGVPPNSGYTLLSEIEDRHIAELQRRKAEALAKNEPSSKVKEDPALSQFEFTDKTPVAGGKYFYRIVPFNQGDVEGQVRQIVRVAFKGEASEVVFIPVNQIEGLVPEED